MKDNDIDGKKIKKALLKKALGYDTTEVVEEYSTGEEGEIILTKKKVTKKPVPPDITALKILLEEDFDDISSLSDEELEAERERLLKLIKKEEKQEV